MQRAIDAAWGEFVDELAEQQEWSSDAEAFLAFASAVLEELSRLEKRISAGDMRRHGPKFNCLQPFCPRRPRPRR